MRPWARLIAMLALAVALPLQGMAAASARPCGLQHADVASARGAPHDAAPVHAGHHGARHAGSPVAHADGTSQFGANDGDPKPAPHCGGCGSAAMLPPIGLPSPAVDAPARVWSGWPTPGAPGFVTGGPERPPRARRA